MEKFYYIKNVYNLKITSLTAQRDMQSLVKILLKIPGLTPGQVASGLRVPPLRVISMEKPEQAEKLKAILEKLGAKCEVEDTKAPSDTGSKETQTTDANKKNEHIKQHSQKKHEIHYTRTGKVRFSAGHRHKFNGTLWLGIFSVMVLFAAITIYSPQGCDNTKSKQQTTKVASGASAGMPKKASSGAPAEAVISDDAADSAFAAVASIYNAAGKTDGELKKDLVKNPYNTAAWKALSESLEKKGDTVSARAAKESYEKSVKAQMVLASLARAFGNKVRVEITEDAVYYRTSKDLTEDDFNYESGKLMDSLEIKFPGKDLIIENYTSDNRVQSVTLISTQPKEKDSPK